MASAISTGSAALLRAISNPLKGWMGLQDTQAEALGRVSGDDLGKVIQGDFIPRLMMQYSQDKDDIASDGHMIIDSIDVEKFASLPLQLEAGELLVEVEAFLHRGVSVEVIFLNLLAPSAREIGRLWEEDECDFVEVTMGLWRLQEVMREVASRSPPVVRSLGTPRTALFSPIPGEQHSFGTLMIDEIFARAGWRSEALIDPERRELLRLVAEKPFDVVGLTITSECPSGPLSNLISAIRTVSANPQTAILVGGKFVNGNPGLAAEVGADGTAVDAEAALKLAASLVEDARLSA